MNRVRGREVEIVRSKGEEDGQKGQMANKER